MRKMRVALPGVKSKQHDAFDDAISSCGSSIFSSPDQKHVEEFYGMFYMGEKFANGKHVADAAQTGEKVD